MINVPYHLGFRWALARRMIYAKRVESILSRPIHSPTTLPLTVVSLSGERDALEQMASWRSFLAHVGTPKEFLLVSDDSHSPRSLALLRRLDSRVRVVSYREFLQPGLPECVYRYARQNPMGKKLPIFLALAQLTPMVYADSDILFFPGASHLRQLLQSDQSKVLYLPDCAPSFDWEIIRDNKEAANPVNAGFLYLKQPISLETGLSRFASPDHPNSFFSEQTMVHLAVHEAGGQPLPSDRYIMRAEDQFAYSDHFVNEQTVLRHYISSIRHKMWRQVGVF